MALLCCRWRHAHFCGKEEEKKKKGKKKIEDGRDLVPASLTALCHTYLAPFTYTMHACPHPHSSPFLSSPTFIFPTTLLVFLPFCSNHFLLPSDPSSLPVKTCIFLTGILYYHSALPLTYLHSFLTPVPLLKFACCWHGVWHGVSMLLTTSSLHPYGGVLVMLVGWVMGRPPRRVYGRGWVVGVFLGRRDAHCGGCLSSLNNGFAQRATDDGMDQGCCGLNKRILSPTARAFYLHCCACISRTPTAPTTAHRAFATYSAYRLPHCSICPLLPPPARCCTALLLARRSVPALSRCRTHTARISLHALPPRLPHAHCTHGARPRL